jgi:hypothetical protein
MPSDLAGILYEEFTPLAPNVSRIEATLRKWGLDWSSPNTGG